MTSPRIAIRTDASRQIGTGHVRRCLALATALRQAGADVRFVTRGLGVDVKAIVGRGFEVIQLPPPTPALKAKAMHYRDWAQVSWARDADETGEGLRDWGPDWIVVDHYAFDRAWHDEVRSALGCRILVVDDLADRPLSPDLLIDQNFDRDHAAKYDAQVPRRTRILSGPRFALLGPTYVSAERHEPVDTVRSVGIFVGGVDLGRVSQAALDGIAKSGFDGAVEVVSTAANPDLRDLEAACRARGATLALDLPDLARFFAAHDIQIGAGGGATWERCCIGAPSLLLVVADNQLAVVPELANAGIAVTTAPLGSLTPDAIAEALQPLLNDAALRRTLSARALALVDGRGAERVALAMIGKTLSVRPAVGTDATLVHRWRNAPETRSVSRTPGDISWDSHLDWFNRTLADPSRRLLIAMRGQIPVGVIRFDDLNDRECEVSLYLDPGLHGLGLGKPMLLAGEAAAATGLDVVAEVKEGNKPSARMFAAAGYHRVSETIWKKPAATGVEAN